MDRLLLLTLLLVSVNLITLLSFLHISITIIILIKTVSNVKYFMCSIMFVNKSLQISRHYIKEYNSDLLQGQLQMLNIIYRLNV